jgi:hypothetical protein
VLEAMKRYRVKIEERFDRETLNRRGRDVLAVGGCCWVAGLVPDDIAPFVALLLCCFLLANFDRRQAGTIPPKE